MPSYVSPYKSGWYGRSWLGWAANNSLTDLHPVVPEAYKRVVVQPLLHLPPALRALHLDAKKGRDFALAVSLQSGGKNSPSPASTAGSTRAEEGAAANRDDCYPEGEMHGRYNRTARKSCLMRKGIGSSCETHDCVGVAGERHGGVRLEGCERILAAQWTERQRTMCLVPSEEGRTVSS